MAPLLASVALAALATACGGESARVDADTGVVRARGRTDRAGRADGEWTWYYPDGTIRERGSFEHGRRIGLWTRWYPNGQRHSAGEREPAVANASTADELRLGAHRVGEWRLWFSNGQLRGQGSYVEGRAEGSWTWWNHSGELDRERTGSYRDGRRVDSDVGG